MARSQIFWGYPSEPFIRCDTIRRAASMISASASIESCLWENLKIGGKIIIQAIMNGIDESILGCFELTELNQNVMFELGYTIGTKKPVWIIRDSSAEQSANTWRKIRILTQVGYIAYKNSEEIKAAYLREYPHQGNKSIYEDYIKSNLSPRKEAALFFIKSIHDTDADRALTRRILKEKQEGIKCILDDADESSVQTLTWYAQKIYESTAVIAHLCGTHREGWKFHNSKVALVCGMAVGMKRKVLMLMEDGEMLPIDYEHLAYIYRSRDECTNYADEWIKDSLKEAYRNAAKREKNKVKYELEAELRALRLGEHIAENEADNILGYFVETSSYKDVLDKQTTLFVGRKGSGKTANLLKASDEISSDKRNLVCVIKPAGYELAGLIRLLKKFREKDAKGFLVESLWKFLIFSEIAWALVESFPKNALIPGTPEWDLDSFLRHESRSLDKEFAVRLEKTVENLDLVKGSDKLRVERLAISEALHQNVLKELRDKLTDLLSRKKHVAILIDNLDKAWEKSEDIDYLVDMLFGLFGAVNSIKRELHKMVSRKDKLSVSLSIFIRNDIYQHVVKMAREPDKLPISRIIWDDPRLLLRIIEERYLTARDYKGDADDMWSNYFCSVVRDIPIKDYIIYRILPRPRDIVLFCNSAISAAINRNNTIVGEDDILNAEKTYSQFAFEAILVENSVTRGDLERILYEFVGSTVVVTREEIAQCVAKSQVKHADVDDIIEHLCSLSFLGREIKENEYSYSDNSSIEARDKIAARKLAEAKCRSPRYKIHAAFCPFLEIAEGPIFPQHHI